MAQNPKESSQRVQSRKLRETARALECDESESAFDAALKRVAKAPVSEKQGNQPQKGSSRSKEHRDSAAKLLKQSRRSDYASIRGSLSKTAAAHKTLAHEEEIARGEPQRSRKRAKPQPKKPGR